MGDDSEKIRAQIRAASGRFSKVIKDRGSVEVSVEVPGAGKLVLSVDSESRYALRTSTDDGETSGVTQLASGKMRATEHEESS